MIFRSIRNEGLREVVFIRAPLYRCNLMRKQAHLAVDGNAGCEKDDWPLLKNIFNNST